MDRYNKIGLRAFQPSPPPMGAPAHTKKLSPGVYTLDSNRQGLYFRRMNLQNDEILELDDPIYRQVVEEMEQFWSRDMRAAFNRYKLMYKRGILLHGLPGTGKTCTIRRVMDQVVEKGGIALFNPEISWVPDAVEMIRLIEKETNHVLIVLEELEEILRRDEHGLLTLLDGQDQFDDVVYIGTTNYLRKIPDRIKRRPSRFCTVLESGFPNETARRQFIEHKLHPDDKGKVDIDFWVKETEGMTIDQLKDLVVQVLCFQKPLAVAIEAVKYFDYQ